MKSLWSSGRELLSEEDIDGVTDTSDSPSPSPSGFPYRPMACHPTIPSWKTGRIPVIGADGQVIQPGEESARALKAEQEAIDAAYAAGRAAVPPSFTPKNPSSASANTDVADAKLFGKLKTKVVAIIVAVIVVAVALGFAVHGLMQPSDSVTTDSKGPWPEINLDEVPFGEEISRMRIPRILPIPIRPAIPIRPIPRILPILPPIRRHPASLRRPSNPRKPRTRS